MNKSILITIVILVVIIGGYFLFRGGGEQTSPESVPQAPSLGVPAPGQEAIPEKVVAPSGEGETAPEQEGTSVVPSTETREFNITARQFSFEPDIITVNKGDTVKLHVTSVDVEHGLSISEFGVNEALRPGETKIIEFVASKSGTYTMFCSVVCGAGHLSMKGTLIVN